MQIQLTFMKFDETGLSMFLVVRLIQSLFLVQMVVLERVQLVKAKLPKVVVHFLFEVL